MNAWGKSILSHQKAGNLFDIHNKSDHEHSWRWWSIEKGIKNEEASYKFSQVNGGYLGLVDKGLQNTTTPTTSTSENNWSEPSRNSLNEQAWERRTDT